MTDQDEVEFEEVNWDEIKDEEIDVLVTDDFKKEILINAGYEIDDKGFLVREETGERVKADDETELNVDRDKEAALISGSHIFVKNVAGYARILTEKGLIRINSD